MAKTILKKNKVEGLNATWFQELLQASVILTVWHQEKQLDQWKKQNSETDPYMTYFWKRCKGNSPEILTYYWWKYRMHKYLENVLQFLKKLNTHLHITQSIPLLVIYSTEMTQYVHTKTFTQKFIATLFVKAQHRKQPKCPLIGEQTNCGTSIVCQQFFKMNH